ncbi:MAG: hypothetical protein ABIG43_01025 [Chloroflexota bacterium]
MRININIVSLHYLGEKGEVVMFSQHAKRPSQATVIVLSQCLTWVVLTVLSARALYAQVSLSGDYRNQTITFDSNGSIPIHVQTDDKGPITMGGLIVKAGEKASFDAHGLLSTRNAGFWGSVERDGVPQEYRVLLLTDKGQKCALVDLRGYLEWDMNMSVDSATLAADSKNPIVFLRIYTLQSEQWQKIVRQSVVDGRVKIVNEKGSAYLIYNFSPLITGSIVPVGTTQPIKH